MRGSEIGLQAVLLHSPLAFVVLDGVALCPRRVDDEVHLLVQDDIENVRAAFSKTLQARVAGKLACA